MWMAILSLAKTFFYLSLFRLAPQDMPAFPIVLILSTIIYFILGILSFIEQYGFGYAVSITFIDLIYLMLFTWLLLSWRGYKYRFLQTMIALIGIHIITSLPLYLVLLGIDTNTEQASNLFIMLLLAIIYWYLALLVHIYRHALSFDFFSSFIVALGYFISSITILPNLLPQNPS